ncbi:MAG: hypothetical protein GQ570_07920 [Helicobacteraceae bacterium]|nr:hypothetical protein [Helicobacteraceae bacterium]
MFNIKNSLIIATVLLSQNMYANSEDGNSHHYNVVDSFIGGLPSDAPKKKESHSLIGETFDLVSGGVVGLERKALKSLLVTDKVDKTENPWTHAAIDWTTDNVLDFGKGLVSKIFGWPKPQQPLYTNDFKVLIDLTADMDKQLREQTALLGDIDGELSQILNLMEANTYASSAKNIIEAKSMIDNEYWVSFTNIIGENNITGEQVLADNKMLLQLKQILTTKNIKKMSGLESVFSGIDVAGAKTFEMDRFFKTRRDYRDTVFTPAIQGTKGNNLVAQMDSLNWTIFGEYLTFSLCIQKVYIMKYIATYLHSNSDKIKDPILRVYYKSLNINEAKLFSTNDADTNLVQLNTNYAHKYLNLFKLFKNDPSKGNTNIISDHNNNENGIRKDNNEYTSAITYSMHYKGSDGKNNDLIPSGQWQQKAILYVWAGAADDTNSSDTNVTGYYDGVTLKAGTFDTREVVSLDLSTCYDPSTDKPVMTYSPSPRSELVCGELSAKTLGITFETDPGYLRMTEQAKSVGLGYDLRYPSNIILDKGDVIANVKKIKKDTDGDYTEATLNSATKDNENSQFIQVNIPQTQDRVIVELVVGGYDHDVAGDQKYVDIIVLCSNVDKSTANWSCKEGYLEGPNETGSYYPYVDINVSETVWTRVIIFGKGWDSKHMGETYIDTCAGTSQKDLDSCKFNTIN